MGNGLLIASGVAGAVTALAALAGRRVIAQGALAIAVASIVAATGRLVAAIAQFDLSYEYVATQSRARSGNAYRLAALWGGAEGSLLFFGALLGLAVAVAAWRFDLGSWGLGVGGAVVGSVAVIVAAAANPFARAALPTVRGAGLTPILEHPAMLYHPPILYLGLVATVVPFLLVLDNPLAVQHDSDSATFRGVRRWLLVAWTLLTIGLATGANWAYVELGWGGYWAWDPVENTVLIPWLVLTAALHLLRGSPRGAGLPRLAIASTALPFVLVLFGATVTRSGGLSSVHAFADAEALGWSLGAVTLVAGDLALWRMRRTRGLTGGLPEVLLSRNSFIVASAALATFMAFVVLVGVGVPLLPGSNRIVTAAFYNRVGTPVLVITLLAMAAFGGWRSVTNHGRKAGVVAATLVGSIAVLLVLQVDDWLRTVVAVAGVGAVVSHIAAARRIPLATTIAHIGFVVLALGIASSAQAETTAVVLAPGESVDFGSGQTFRYESFIVEDGPRFRSEAVTVDGVLVDDAGNAVVELRPALVSYPDRGVALAETALHSTPERDIQVVLRVMTDEGLGSFEVSERPALMLVWWGSALIAMAGVVALVGGADRARRSTSATA